MNAIAWPPVRKSAAMRNIEALYPNEDGGPQDIRDILLTALSDSPTDKHAATSLNIDNTTLSAWIYKLHLSDRASAIRGERNE